MVRNLIKIQEAYINTYHPDFMGGANSIVNVFDMSNYTNNAQTAVEDDEDGEQQPVGQAARAMNKFGADMIKKNKHVQEDSAAQTEGRLQNFNQYEIQKYRKQEQPKIHMPDMPTFMRAQNDDPGQSSPRSQLETHIIKNLIVSYFNTVRKSMNDMVPKTIMAFMVNKTKNLAQRELVSALYNDSVDLRALLSEDSATVRKREAAQEMVEVLRKSLEFLNEVRDFYFESDAA